MLHDAGNAGKPSNERFWVGNAAKRCVQNAIAAVAHEGRTVPLPNVDGNAEPEFNRHLFDR